MSMDDLLKGLGAFNAGLTQYAVGQGIAQAQQQVNDLNSMQMKEMEKRQALSQISNNLVMQLSQAGADPTRIQQVAGTIAPKALQNSGDYLALGAEKGDAEVTALGQQLQQQENAVQMGENSKNRNLQRELQANSLASAEKIAGMKGERKLNETELKEVTKAANLFEQKNADVFKGYQLAGTALKMLNSNNPVADKAVLNSLVKASGDTGVITDSDRAAFAGSEAWDSKLIRWQQKIRTGKLDPKSRQELMQLAQLYQTRQKETAQANARRLSKGLANRLKGDAAEFEPMIFAGFDSMEPQPQPQNAAAATQQPGGLPPGLPAGSRPAVNARGEQGYLAPDGKTFYKQKKAAPSGSTGGF